MSVNPDNLYLKVLNVDGSPCHGGTGTWHLPRGSKPGQWMPPVKPVPCQSGYHVLGSARQALEWIGPAFFLCEVRGEVIDHSDKFVAEQARLVERLPWDDRSARLFAADCAEDVLPIFERDHPGDDRPRCAIEAARLFADGLIGSSELAAAWDAARDAARDAAWDAARAAAWAAARDDAARDAAWAAAWAAAWDAVRAAAWDDAARDAAWAAAWAAARDAQAVRLAGYLGIEP